MTSLFICYMGADFKYVAIDYRSTRSPIFVQGTTCDSTPPSYTHKRALCIQGTRPLLCCRGDGFVMIPLFSTHRRVPVLQSTRVYVMSLPLRWSLESVRLLALM